MKRFFLWLFGWWGFWRKKKPTVKFFVNGKQIAFADRVDISEIDVNPLEIPQYKTVEFVRIGFRKDEASE